MKGKYAQWITENVTDAYAKCAEYTLTMQQVFPELIRVRGHYDCPIWGSREHWWLVDPDSEEIVDPTASQFPSKGVGKEWYTPHEEGSREPTGKCLNCGEYVYGISSTCNEFCHNEVMNSFM